MANDIIDIIVTDNSDNVQLNVTPNLVTINVSQTSGNIIGSNYFLANNYAALPATGESTTLYITNDTSLMYRWSGSAYVQVNSVTSWGTIAGTLSSQTDLQNALNLKAPLASPAFTGTVTGVTKTMVGLSNVDNTSDVNKPVSTATQTALDLKSNINNPTFTGTVVGVTKAMVGLGNVDNTTDLNKPISTATQSSLDTKAPIASPTFTGTVGGITKSMVGLSNVDNTTDLNKPISTATQTAIDLKANTTDVTNSLALKAPLASPTFTGTVSGITKTMVGLANVDNTTDANKPISTATQTALDLKAPLASPTFTGTVSGITKSMVGLENVDNTTDLLKPISTATQTALNLKYDASNPSGYTTNVGTVTSVGGTGTVSGLSLSGSVTTSGNLTLGGTLSLTSGNVTTALGYTPENSANKGIANGYASLDGGGLVPSTQLPSYVDDVLEFADLAAFPASGTTGKIYVALDTNKIYRWSGATYIEVSPTVGTIWGGITGTLSNQTDLQNALNAKQNNLSGTGFVKSTAGTISYDTSTYYPYPTGDTTQYVGGDGSLISFPIAGQSGTIVRLIRNNTGATLTKGTVIYISGATGNNPVVSKAIATGDATSAQTFGLCQANIANNATGYVVVMGDLIGLDTSAFTEGQQVYLSGTVAGTFTATKQYAPIHLVYIGVITRAHPTLGQIEVKIQNGYELDELHNVSAQSPANNDGIFYNTSTSLWEKKSIATVLGYTPANAARSLTINGTAYDLTADRSWSVGTVTSVAALTLGTTGTDVSSSVATGTTTPVITLNIPTASGTNRGALSSTDWSTFNNKQSTITLTTTGTSGAATFSANTLNIPQYSTDLSGYVTLATTQTISGAKTFNNSDLNTIFVSNPDTTGATTGSGIGFKAYNGTSVAQYAGIILTSNTWSYGTYSAQQLSIGADGTGGLALRSANFAPITFHTGGATAGVSTARLTIASTGAATFSSSVSITDTASFGGQAKLFSRITADATTVGKIADSGFHVWNTTNVGSLSQITFGYTNGSTTNASVYLGLITINGVGTGYGDFVLGTAPSANAQCVERLRIASTGAATFSSSVTVNGASATTSLNVTGSGANGILLDQDSASAGASSRLFFKMNTQTYAMLADSNGLNFLSGATAGSSTGSAKMIITSGGAALIGTNSIPSFNSSADSWTAIYGDYSSAAAAMQSYSSTTLGLNRTTSDGIILNFLKNGTSVGSISTNTYSLPSDLNFKKNINTLNLGLNLITKLRAVSYNHKIDDNGAALSTGFIAQELEQSLTELGVNKNEYYILQNIPNEDTSQSQYWLDYSKLIPVLTKAIQELSAKVSLLENK